MYVYGCVCVYLNHFARQKLIQGCKSATIKKEGKKKKKKRGISLPIQWLRLCASTAGGMDLNPGGELDRTCQAHPRKKEKKKIAQTQALKGSDDNI